MKNLFCLLLITLLYSFSNNNQDEKLVLNENDSLVFIRYSPKGQYGYTFYKLTKNQVFRNLTYFTYINQFKFYYNDNPERLVDLGSDKFNLTKDLVKYFPNRILAEERRIGNRSSFDDGAIYIQLTKNGVTKIWELESNPNLVPQEYRVFVQKVNEKINQLR
ncbi:hypothetical protein [Flavobacterium sp.]|uniref:hypothetical protein n=1 Tax=Flavobacterium sp. TaxID=239 RepID=UPI0037519F00